MSFLHDLEKFVGERSKAGTDESYTARLFAEGTSRIRQKVGEEAVEVVLACEQGPQAIREESADLLYHLLVLWQAYGVTLTEIEDLMQERDRRKDQPK